MHWIACFYNAKFSMDAKYGLGCRWENQEKLYIEKPSEVKVIDTFLVHFYILFKNCATWVSYFTLISEIFPNGFFIFWTILKQMRCHKHSIFLWHFYCECQLHLVIIPLSDRSASNLFWSGKWDFNLPLQYHSRL